MWFAFLLPVTGIQAVSFGSVRDSLKNGDDFNEKRFNTLIRDLQAIKKQAKKFKTAEEVPQAYIYK